MKLATSLPKGGPEAVAAARAFARSSLADLPADTLGSVLLVISELATNAVVHAKTGFDLRLEDCGDHVRIEVVDSGQGTPAARSDPTTALHGRGLLIVGSLSSSWGFQPATSGAGKTVWAVVPVDAAEGDR